MVMLTMLSTLPAVLAVVVRSLVLVLRDSVQLLLAWVVT
jgi:hypothetical protein